MATAARQGDSAAKKWSLARDNQFHGQYEAAFSALGNGVLEGGAVTQDGALGVELAASTVVLCEGVRYALADALAYGPLTAEATNYLWGLVVRTPADQSSMTAEDTYALVLSHVADDDTPPGAAHIPLAVVVADDEGITGITEPRGKYLRRGHWDTYTETDEIATPADTAFYTWEHEQGYQSVQDARCRVQTDDDEPGVFADAAGFEVARIDQNPATGVPRDGDTEVWRVTDAGYAGEAETVRLVLWVQGA